jgi:hypothetical protein
MSQHDFTIDNQTFPATRSDINSALQALASLSSGASSPSTTFAYQLWVNTTADPNILNVRNSANNAWIEIGEVNQASAAFILTAYAYLQAGAAATPSHSFDDDRDTGMYRAAANIIGFATNGTVRVRINDSGQAEFSSGTAALPSITTIGDTNTGIFFPAADTIAFTEGGAEAMRINSSGNVGIGTSSQTARLELTDNQFHQLYLLSSTTVSGIRFGNTSFTNGYIYYDNGPNLIFQSNGAERFRIASSGQLGIGGATYGTSGQVLTSGGSAAAPSWATPNTGVWTVISTQTASASSSIDFTGLSGYSRLRLSAQGITASTSSSDHRLRISSDNGATYLATSSYSNRSAYPTSATATGFASSTDTSFALYRVGYGTFTGMAYEFTISNFNIARKTQMFGWTQQEDTSQDRAVIFNNQSASTAMNAIRILQSTGTITTGTFILEGIVG